MLSCAALVAACATACRAGQEEQTIPPVVLGMSAQAPAIFQDNETSIYQVSIPVPLPVRRWTDEEVRALGPLAPYPRAPFLKSSDIRVEVRFTLTNVDDKRQPVELLLDPWNEFVRYHPGLQTINETSSPNYSGFQKSFVLDPKERIEGIITPDDTLELSVDLATAQAINAAPPAADAQLNAAALMNRAFNLQNRSNQPDLALQGFIPKVVPGLTGFDLGLRVTKAGGGPPPNIAVELVIDVRDMNGDRVVPPGDTTRQVGTPRTLLSPPGAM